MKKHRPFKKVLSLILAFQMVFSIIVPNLPVLQVSAAENGTVVFDASFADLSALGTTADEYTVGSWSFRTAMITDGVTESAYLQDADDTLNLNPGEDSVDERLTGQGSSIFFNDTAMRGSSAYNNVYTTFPYKLGEACENGDGQWYFDIDLSIDSLMDVNGKMTDNGFGFDLDFGVANISAATDTEPAQGNGKLFRFVFTKNGIGILNQNKDIAYQSCDLNEIIGDGAFHNISISAIGGGTIAVFVDGVQKAIFKGIAGIVNPGAPVWSSPEQEGFRFINLCDADGLGITKVFVQNARLVVNAIAPEAENLVDVVYFDDDCSSLAEWKKQGTEAESQYFSDSAEETLPPAPEGNFKVYADSAAAADTANGIYKAMSNPFTDSHDWNMTLRMKINELPKIGAGLEAYDGFGIKYLQAEQGIYYWILFAKNADDKDVVRYRKSGETVQEIVLPSGIVGAESDFHDYSFVWNAASKKLSIFVDGQPIGEFDCSAGNTQTGSGGPTLYIDANNYNRNGANTGKIDVLIDRITVAKEAPEDTNLLAENPCDSLNEPEWSYINSGKVDLTFDDTTRDGSFYIFSEALKENRLGAVDLTTGIHLAKGEKWLMEMDMQIDSLRDIFDTYKCYHGLFFALGNGEEAFKVFFNADGISISNHPDKTLATIPFPSGIIGDGKTHTYGFSWDGKNTLMIAVDDVKIAAVPGALIAGADERNQGTVKKYSNKLYITEDNYAPVEYNNGTDKVYIDNIMLRKNTTPDWAQYESKVKFINVLPTAAADSFKAQIFLNDIPEDMIGSENHEVVVNIYPFIKDYLGKEKAEDKVIEKTVSIPVSGELLEMEASDLSANKHYTIEAKLINKKSGIEMSVYNRDFLLDAKVSELAADGAVSGDGETSYLFTDMNALAKASYRWKGGAYSFDGKTGNDYIESLGDAGPITLPVSGTGKYAVYVGYLNGTEEFEVSSGSVKSRVEVVPERERVDHEKATLYGSRSTGEVFATVVDFAKGEHFQIIPVKDCYARIAYIKLKPMTVQDNEIWEKESDGINRLIYNNDGFSGFFDGYYTLSETVDDLGREDEVPDLENIKWAVLGRFDGMDIKAVDWTLGTTFAINHPSEFTKMDIWEDAYLYLTGRENLIPTAVRATAASNICNRLRSGDKRAIKAFNAYISRNISPLKLLEEYGDELGIDVNVSLRMEAFYNPEGDDRWLNATTWYEDLIKVKTKDKKDTSNISFMNEEFQDYLINILIESVERYGADGVNIDFDRYPNTLGYELADYGYDVSTDEKLYAAKREVMNAFMRRVREELPEGTKITVRIPITEYGDQYGSDNRGYINNGLDFPTWLNEGWIDVIIPGSISYEEFQDLTPFIEAVEAAKEKGKDVSFYCGITVNLGGHDLTKEEEDLINQGIPVDTGHKSVSLQQYRLRANEAYSKGAEALYIFNSWTGQDTAGYIGDKAAVEKWYTLAYEAEYMQNLASIEESSVVEGIDPPKPPVVDPVDPDPAPPQPSANPETPDKPVTPPETPNAVELRDIAGSWAEEYILTLAKKGIVSGDQNKNYNPGADITRAEFAVILYKALKLDAGGDIAFEDVTAGSWYTDPIKAVVKAGIMSGYSDTTFGPLDKITREQAMVALANAIAYAKLNLASEENALADFTDTENLSDWAIESAKLVVTAGIICGSDGKINAKADITKAEVARVIVAFLELLDSENLD